MNFVPGFGRNKSTNEYDELSNEDLGRLVGASQQIYFVDVTSQNDLISAKEALHDGNIVLLDVSYIESNGLSLESVYGEIKQATDSFEGDVVHKDRNDMIVATPRDISVNRQKL